MTATMLFDGTRVGFRPGDTIATALARHADGLGMAPPPMFCGIGQCQVCIVEVAGRGPVEACLTPCEPGMTLRRLLPSGPGSRWGMAEGPER